MLMSFVPHFTSDVGQRAFNSLFKLNYGIRLELSYQFSPIPYIEIESRIFGVPYLNNGPSVLLHWHRECHFVLIFFYNSENCCAHLALLLNHIIPSLKQFPYGKDVSYLIRFQFWIR